MITFTVQGDAVGKGRARSRIVKPKKGAQFVSHYTPEKTRNYEQAVAWAAKAAWGGRPVLEGACWLRVQVFVRIPESWPKRDKEAALAGRIYPTNKPDLDNVEKSIADAMNGIVYVDDAQICRVEKFKQYDPNPRVVVTVQAAI